MQRSLVVMLSLVLLGAALVWWSRAERPVSSTAQASQELALEVRALKREVGLLRAQTFASGPAPAPGEPAVAADMAAPTLAAPSVQPNAELSPEARLQQTADQLDDRFEQEPRDAAWALEMSRQIRQAVSDSAPDSRVIDVACASSLCRVTLGHASESIALLLASAPCFQTGVFYQPDRTSSPPQTTLYVLRENHSFRELASAE